MIGEYSAGTFRKNLERGKWQGRIRFRDSHGDKWRAKTCLFDIPCNAKTNSGEMRAKSEFSKWRSEFIAAHEIALANAARKHGLTSRTVGEYVDSYTSDLQTLGRQPSTISGYRRMIRYINDGAPAKSEGSPDISPVSIGHIELEELSREAIQLWVNDMSERLAPVTVKKALTLLSAALKNACRDDRIPRNPAEFVNPPAMNKAPQNPLDEHQQRLLISDLNSYIATHPNDPSRLAIKTALLTGMRQGELCALTWSDVDFDSEVLQVRRSIGRNGDSYGTGNASYYIKETKTDGSRRTIPISGPLLEDLKAHEANVVSQCAENKIAFSRSLYVFGNIDGTHMSPHALWRKWSRIVKRLHLVGLDGGIPKFHDLRHTFATTAIKHGMDVKTLSSILGHSNAAMTLNIYASADPDAKRLAMHKMGELFESMSPDD